MRRLLPVLVACLVGVAFPAAAQDLPSGLAGVTLSGQTLSGQSLLLIALVTVPSLGFVFAAIGSLPWPIADYTWAMCTFWAAVLAGLYAAARRART